jgi:hypothetical protein
MAATGEAPIGFAYRGAKGEYCWRAVAVVPQ